MKKTASKAAAILCLVLAAALCGCSFFVREYDEDEPMHRHSWGEDLYLWEIPTCVSTGTAYRMCDTCGVMDLNSMTELPIDPDGHYWQSTGVIWPTCTQPGKDIQTCAYPECTSTDTNEIEIAALGHDRHIAYPPILEPTCTGLGIEIESCIRDGCEAPDPQEIDIPALGHDRYLYETLSLPKCILPGRAIYHCWRGECEEPDIEGDIEALGHDAKMSITLQPTCTRLGTETESCVRKECGAYLGEFEIPALGHDRKIKSRTVWETCTATGKGIEECSRTGCEAPDPQEITIAALGHNVKIGGTEKPTCTAPGRQGQYCDRIGCDFSEIIVLPATGHDDKYEIWIIATCLTAGSGRNRCTICDRLSESIRIAPLGHDWYGTSLGYRCRRFGCIAFSLTRP